MRDITVHTGRTGKAGLLRAEQLGFEFAEAEPEERSKQPFNHETFCGLLASAGGKLLETGRKEILMARTTLGPSTILLIVAVILFVLGAFVTIPVISLIPLGLAAFAGAFLVRELT